MQYRVLTVRERFTIRGRGVVLSGEVHSRDPWQLKVGDIVELRRPNNTPIKVPIIGVAHDPASPSLLLSISPGDAPDGTEIWTTGQRIELVEPSTPPPQRVHSPWHGITIVAITALLAVLVVRQVPYLNGPAHWQWEWRRLPSAAWYWSFLGAAMLVFWAILLRIISPKQTVLTLISLMVALLAMKLASVAVIRPPTGMSFIADVVKSPEATSYFTDAAALGNYPGWFADYEHVLPETTLHSRSKPPGPLLYWSAMIRMFGYTDRAAIIGGLLQGILATLAIPATWWVVKLLTDDRDAAFYSASALGLCPGFVLFFPMFDPIYIIISCAMIGTWHLAVTRDSFGWAAGCGLVLMFATMTSYPLLTLGFFLVLHGLLSATRPFARALMLRARHGLIALIVLITGYLVLFASTGFDPIAAFKAAWHNQQQFLAQHEPDRLWPRTIPWDLADFALGAGWICVIVAIMHLIREIRSGGQHRMLVLLCLAQPVAVALSGLVQSETARVWNFMLPLVLLPVGLELARWKPAQRLTFYACLWLLLAVIGQNMRFVNPGLD